MGTRIGAAIAAVALSGSTIAAQGPALHFSPSLPGGWQQRTVVLVMKDVTVPRSPAATLRVYALEQANRDARRLLGSYGLPADSPDAQGTRTLPRVPVSVTSALRRWKTAPAEGPVDVVVEPVDAKGRVLTSYSWTAGSLTFETR
jgi:hypothetical protein